MLIRNLRLVLTALLATTAMAAMSEAAPAQHNPPTRCQGTTVCISDQKTATGIELIASNQADFPVSLSVYAKLDNYVAEPGRSLSRVIEAGATIVFMRLTERDTARPASYRYWFDWSPGRLDAKHDDNYLYRLPYASGSVFRVLQGYGSRFSHRDQNRYAVDFDMPVGTPVHAARNGLVVKTEGRHNKGCWEDGCGKFANFIVVLHDDGTTGEYYHLRKNGVLVDVNERVRAGQVIGFSGNTGHTTMPHLHFAVYRPGSWGKFESLPVRFRAREGEINSPRAGGRYTAD